VRAFVRGEFDVLVSTTIVENGLDIARANTILIDEADHFGLAELHQLRGRVGRSDAQGVLLPAARSAKPMKVSIARER
jgi:transcription-repair coupling factor (superfamily II helicase)